MKDRVWKRINSWRGRTLSKVRKRLWLNYVMSVYFLPETTIKEIERMMNSFWWGWVDLGSTTDTGTTTNYHMAETTYGLV
jgi:hypothetical protein